jgi:hypothetical protein
MANEGKVAGELLYAGVSADAGAQVAGNLLYTSVSADAGGRVAGCLLYVVIAGGTAASSGPPITQGNAAQGFVDQDGNAVGQGRSFATQGARAQGS